MELTRLQKQLSDHVRDPEASPGPADVEQRRLDIYRDLFFNTVEGFLCTAFPVARKLYAEDAWRALVRDFMRCHQCASPYFVQLAEEFLEYLSGERVGTEADPPFLIELAHYEWVELALDISTETLPPAKPRSPGELPAVVQLSPLAWSLAYQFPVHQISPGFQPEVPGELPSFLLVYRNREDEVGFVEINAATARLLALLGDQGGVVDTCIDLLATEMGMACDAVRGFANELLEQWLNQDILL